MRCPNCESDNLSVVDTISSQRENYRHRKCADCEFRFYTTEAVVPKEEVEPKFKEWQKERSRKCRAKKKGIAYEPTFEDGREKTVIPKKPTSPLF